MSQPSGLPNAQQQDPDLDNLINQVTQADSTTTTQPAPPEPKPLTVNIMGRDMQFKDEADLGAQLTQYVQSLQQQAQSQPEPKGHVSGKEDDNQPDRWTEDDMKEYVRLMGTNPIHAQNFIDKRRFGTDDPMGLVRQLAEDNQRINRTLTAVQFKEAHPNLQMNPQVANMLEQRRLQLGVPFTYEGLEATYWSLVGVGALPAPPLPNQPQPPPPQYQQQSGGYNPPPPPNVSRSGPDANANWEMESRWEGMTPQQIAQVLTEYQNRTQRGR